MFLRPDKPIIKHLNHLPHWQQDSCFVFVTWRLADSVPAGLSEKWRTARDLWLKTHPKPWDEKRVAEYHHKFSTQMEEWLDQGMGQCHLRSPNCAQLVMQTLLHFDQQRYHLDSFVIMPNHVHILFRLHPDHPLEKVIQSWKRYSARAANDLLKKKGSFWHKRYWDTLVRNENHFWKIRRYIQNNPTKANLPESNFLLYLPWENRAAT